MQLRINEPEDIIFEWIPYNQFNIIKEVCKNSVTTTYLAIWKDGPLDYDDNKNKHTRMSNKKIGLKYLYNSQNIIIEVRNFPINYEFNTNSFSILINNLLCFNRPVNIQ